MWLLKMEQAMSNFLKDIPIGYVSVQKETKVGI